MASPIDDNASQPQVSANAYLLTANGKGNDFNSVTYMYSCKHYDASCRSDNNAVNCMQSRTVNDTDELQIQNQDEKLTDATSSCENNNFFDHSTINPANNASTQTVNIQPLNQLPIQEVCRE